MKNIVETAIEAGKFSTLVKAVQGAGLADTLAGEGPFTVFAPTDEAFAKIPDETMKAVLADTDKLTSILKFHVVSGKVMAEEVVKMSTAKTLQGGELTIKTENGVMVGNDATMATVVTPDVECTNGVIHIIDTVLMPS